MAIEAISDSSDEPELLAIDKIMEHLAERGLTDQVKSVTSDVVRALGDGLEKFVLDAVEDQLHQRLRRAASDMANRCVSEALAGDDKRLRELFGLWHLQYDGPYLIHGEPYLSGSGHKLLRELCRRYSDLLTSEHTRSLSAEVEWLRKENAELTATVERLRDRNARLNAAVEAYSGETDET